MLQTLQLQLRLEQQLLVELQLLFTLMQVLRQLAHTLLQNQFHQMRYLQILRIQQGLLILQAKYS